MELIGTYWFVWVLCTILSVTHLAWQMSQRGISTQKFFVAVVPCWIFGALTAVAIVVQMIDYYRSVPIS